MKIALFLLAAALSTSAGATGNTPTSTRALADFATCAKPEWPREALRGEQTGTVTLAFLIGTDGAVKESKIAVSSGFAQLDEAAQRGIARCIFKPASVAGQAVEQWTKMRYVWTLDSPSAGSAADIGKSVV